ncbi:MAG: FAD binding domain-containing protein, partial [Desulfitobacteriaceae bacterium]|nr:FAD binding domain-containing protein [Desulfitobacteriaceae bacterium]
MINTRVLSTDFEYFEPKTIEEAVSLLGKYKGEARVLAGGTDLLIDMKRKRIEPKYLINIKGIQDLNYIREDGGLQIGAATSIRRIEKSQLVKKGYLALFEAAQAFGTVQIRNMATIGGNICNGLPSADIPPALVAFDARVKIVGPMEERFLPLK